MAGLSNPMATKARSSASLIIKQTNKMAMIKLMAGKLHRARVTNANIDYIGSISIDSELLDKANILPMQEIEIVNISNGNRWSTYALPGAPSSGEICPNGGGALLCEPGDILIIFSYAYLDPTELDHKAHNATTLVLDASNACTSIIEQELLMVNRQLSYASHEHLP
jgi:aspartate 1-decarboxylase